MIGNNIYAQQIDPVLAGAVTASGVAESVAINSTKNAQNKIAKLFDGLRKSAVANPQGVLMLGIVSKEITKATSEMVGIYSYISTLSLSKKVLLNSAERSQITWTVLYKLRKIKSSLYLLKFQIENYTLADLPQILFPMEYFYAIDGKRIADNIIKDFKKL